MWGGWFAWMFTGFCSTRRFGTCSTWASGFSWSWGVGMLILNLVMLVLSYRRTGPILGIIVSLLIIGISVRWDWFVLAISEVMGGVVQYLGYYLHILIYQWLAQHTPTIITPLV